MNKKKLILSVAGLALLGGGLYFGLAYSLPLLTSQIIRQNGFPEARVKNFYVTPTGVMIDHISLDSNDFSTVDNINITMSWIDFIKDRKIQSVTVKDISLTAELDDTGHFKIAGWDATLPQSGGNGSSLLPLQSILLQGITVDLDTPQGDIRIEGKLSLDTPNNTEQNIQYAIWGQQHQLSFDTKGSGKLSSNGDISFTTTLNEGRLNLPSLELSRASGELTIQKTADGKPPVYTGQLIAGKINTLGALLQNVTVNLDTTKPEALFFTTSPAGYKDITLTGRWVTTPDSHLEFILNSAKSLDIVELLAPEKNDTFSSWLKDANPLSVTLTAPIASLQNDQKRAAYQINLGTSKTARQLVASGNIVYDAEKGTALVDLKKTNISIAGGKIDVSPFSVNSDYTGTPPLSMLLTVTSVDMAKLATLADVKGLNARGRLSGSLPVTYSTDGIIFGEGSLKSEGAGTFAYTPDKFPPSLQGDDPRMETVRKTLSDFRFSKFNVDMSGSVDDKMKTSISAEGTNPALGERPIKLNLNLDGDLGAVLKQTLQTVDFGSKIRDQMTPKDKK
jgi:hypothetical protein